MLNFQLISAVCVISLMLLGTASADGGKFEIFGHIFDIGQNYRKLFASVG